MINHPNRSKKTATEPALTMTLGDIRRKGPCQGGWLKLIRSVGDDPKTVVSLGDIAMSNDASDATWCFRCLDWSDIAIRRSVISGAVLPAVKRASQHTKDIRVAEAVSIIERWCAGDDMADLKKASKTAAAAGGYAAAAGGYAAADAAAAAATTGTAATSAAYAAYASAAAAAAAAAAAVYAAVDAAVDAVYAAVDARKIEREHQRQDIIAAFPPVALAEKRSKPNG